ncbi:piggyBac transposable element-derived protein 3-like [Watersipora subatra]|uniref:piggyBac transposable element-derived protein 3-like n=1 Tax=Watersipora subatra TaxID=2589382 RepID=UPI00355C8C01
MNGYHTKAPFLVLEVGHFLERFVPVNTLIFFSPIHQFQDKQKQLTVQNVLEIIDGDESDFGEFEESDDEDFLPAQDQPNVSDDNSSGEEESNLLLNELAVPEACKRDKSVQQSRPVYRWRKKDFVAPDVEYAGLPTAPPIDIVTPLLYFQKFIGISMIATIAEQTNLYSVQKNGKSIDTSSKEIEQVIGMFLHMGLVRMSSIRQYWESESSYGPVSDIMSRNRFEALLFSLHFVDNMAMSEEVRQKDKLWKIRPILDNLQQRCLAVSPSQHCSIDEMIVPYNGKKSPIRQYIKRKPHPWGFKICGRAGIDGLLHDFDVYQGGDGQRTELGLGADVVLKLTSTLAPGKNHKVFADNVFTSLPLIAKLKERGILYTGTVRQNRLKGCPLSDEKTLKKKGRGSFDYRVEDIHNVAAVRWYDNRAVTLLSTEAAVEPIGEAKRWDKKQKQQVTIPMPALIRNYNSYMGGIDLLDSYLAKYRFLMRSRRWYTYLFWQCIMIGVVNAWLLYRRDCQSLELPAKEVLNRRRFQAIFASSMT